MTRPVQTTAPAANTQSRTVYRTPTGKKYHFSKECAGKNAISVTLDSAINFYHLEPCQKCANG